MDFVLQTLLLKMWYFQQTVSVLICNFENAQLLVTWCVLGSQLSSCFIFALNSWYFQVVKSLFSFFFGCIFLATFLKCDCKESKLFILCTESWMSNGVVAYAVQEHLVWTGIHQKQAIRPLYWHCAWHLNNSSSETGGTIHW
jgi:hypothetical protein